MPLRQGRDQSGDCATGRLPSATNAHGRCSQCWAETQRAVRRRLLRCSRRLLQPTQTTHWSDSDPDPSRCVRPSAQLVHPAGPGQLAARRAGRQLRWKGRRPRFRRWLSGSCRWGGSLLLLGSTCWVWLGLAGFLLRNRIGWVGSASVSNGWLPGNFSPAWQRQAGCVGAPSASAPPGIGSDRAQRRECPLKPAVVVRSGVTSSTRLL